MERRSKRSSSNSSSSSSSNRVVAAAAAVVGVHPALTLRGGGWVEENEVGWGGKVVIGLVAKAAVAVVVWANPSLSLNP